MDGRHAWRQEEPIGLFANPSRDAEGPDKSGHELPRAHGGKVACAKQHVVSDLILRWRMTTVVVNLLCLLGLVHSSTGILHNLFHFCNMGGSRTRRRGW